MITKGLFRSALFALIILITNNDFLVAQENEIDDTESNARHELYLSLAYTYIPKGTALDNIENRGHFVPSIGLDYYYLLNERWRLGLLFDYEMGSYLIPHRENLERERALIIALSAGYKLSRNWTVFVALGNEFERHENLVVIRLGLEYAVELKNEWFIPIGVFNDIKEKYSTWSINVGIGKAFK